MAGVGANRAFTPASSYVLPRVPVSVPPTPIPRRPRLRGLPAGPTFSHDGGVGARIAMGARARMLHERIAATRETR